MDQENQQTQEENILEQQRRELEEIDNQNKTRKEIDTIYDEIGFGKYQYRSTVLFALFFMLFSIQILTPTLFFQDPTYLCNGKVCSNKDYCKTDSQNRGIQEDTSIYSITRAFELYCGSGATQKSIGESMEFVGSMFALIIVMWIGDNYGRRVANAISIIVSILGGVCIVCFNNVVMVFIGLFLVGGGVQAAGFTQLILLNEMSTGHKRTMIVCLMYVTFGLAELLIWPLSLITSDYRYFNLYFLLIPYVLCLCLPYFVFESPKFYQQKNMDKCVETINSIAKSNGYDKEYTEQDIQIVDKSSQKQYNYFHLFKYASIRKTTVCMVGLSVGIHALYYGMQFSLDLIGSDFAKNTFYIGIADFLGYSMSDFICPKFPRKKWLIITLGVSSLFCFSFAIDPVPSSCQDDGESCIQKTMQIVQAMLSRFIISFSFSFMIIWMQELFPTSVRSIGVGFVAAAGLLGAELTPFIKQASEDYFIVILGVFGVIGAASVFFLRETFEQPLQEEIPELTRRFSVHHSIARPLDNDDLSSVSEAWEEKQAKQGIMKTNIESINSTSQDQKLKQKLLD